MEGSFGGRCDFSDADDWTETGGWMVTCDLIGNCYGIQEYDWCLGKDDYTLVEEGDFSWCKDDYRHILGTVVNDMGKTSYTYTTIIINH